MLLIYTNRIEKLEEERAEKNKVRNWTIYGLLVSACLVAYFYLENKHSSSNHDPNMSFLPVCCGTSSLRGNRIDHKNEGENEILEGN